MRSSECHPRKPYFAKGLCRQCYQAKYYQEHREEYLLSNYKNRYDLTENTLRKLQKVQNNVCAICGDKPSKGQVLALDHDHITEMVRGLLCRRCNTALAFFERFADEAKAYLRNPPMEGVLLEKI